MMHEKELGITFFELLIVVIIIGVVAIICTPSLMSFEHHQKNDLLKWQLKNMLALAKTSVMANHETLAFCLGNQDKCSHELITVGLLYADLYQDGMLHHPSQLRMIIPFSSYHGKLLFRSFPAYRTALLFKASHAVESDNGTFWLCQTTNKKPQWGIAINRFAMVHDLPHDHEGYIIDTKGKRLPC